MITLSDSPSDAVLLAPSVRPILERFDIGASESSTSIEAQAIALGLNPSFLVQLANASLGPKQASHTDFEKYDIPVLLDYLKRSHDYYLKKRLPEIGQSIHAMRRKFEREDPIYLLLSAFFVSYSKELEAHFEYEEKHLFPYAKRLAQRNDQWKLNTDGEAFSVRQFLTDHTDTEQELHAVRQMLLRYRAPKDSELPYQVLLMQLASFEQDMHLHALIEDEVLVPKLAELETELSNQKAR